MSKKNKVAIMINMKAVFDSLFEGINGFNASYTTRNTKQYYYVGETYGEITYDGFKNMLQLVQPKEGDVFYDLGAGVGKAAIIASLDGRFKKVVGIEIMPDLHRQAVLVGDKLRRSSLEHTTPEFILGDFKSQDFADADVIYINATCMMYELNMPFLNKLSGLKKGTRILTNGLTLYHPQFTASYAGIYDFSWGPDEVHVHYKFA